MKNIKIIVRFLALSFIVLLGYSYTNSANSMEEEKQCNAKAALITDEETGLTQYYCPINGGDLDCTYNCGNN